MGDTAPPQPQVQQNQSQAPQYRTAIIPNDSAFDRWFNPTKISRDIYGNVIVQKNKSIFSRPPSITQVLVQQPQNQPQVQQNQPQVQQSQQNQQQLHKQQLLQQQNNETLFQHIVRPKPVIVEHTPQGPVVSHNPSLLQRIFKPTITLDKTTGNVTVKDRFPFITRSTPVVVYPHIPQEQKPQEQKPEGETPQEQKPEGETPQEQKPDPQAQVPDALFKQAIDINNQIRASIYTNNNPSVMNSFKKPPSIFLLVMITLGLSIATYIIAEIANYYEIKRNWSLYQCMPSVAPFAAAYGYSLSETMNFCVSQSVKEHAPGVINPIYSGISAINSVVDGVYGKVTSIESGIFGLLKGFEDFVVNFLNAFGLIGTRVRMSLIRIKDIFARVYGLFVSFAYAAISTITFGSNLVCNPLVVFLGAITGVDICCFAPNTPIRMADGSVRPIAAIQIGDRLAGGSEVVSTYLFDGSTTTMVRIDGVHVSGNHYLEEGGRWVQARSHGRAQAAERLDRLWCLGTDTNLIPIVTDTGDAIFKDYEESSEPAVIAAAQAIAETTLNGPGSIPGPTVPNYSLGLDPTLHILMQGGAWIPLATVQIGDVLSSGAVVKGLIREVCDEQCVTPAGFRVSAAQLVLYKGIWTRAALFLPSADAAQVLYHVMLDRSDSMTVGGEDEVLVVRDYAEITAEAIQAPYDQKMTGA